MYAVDDQWMAQFENFLAIVDSILLSLDDDPEIRSCAVLRQFFVEHPPAANRIETLFSNTTAQRTLMKIRPLLDMILSFLQKLPQMSPTYEEQRQQICNDIIKQINTL